MRISVRAIIIKDSQILVMDRDKFGFKYLSLIGGAKEANETEIEALHREVWEETSIKIADPRLVIIEDAGDVYGIQYIYLCTYLSGEVHLDENSDEAKINQAGKNLYKPIWFPLKDLPTSNLLPIELRDLLVEYINSGFPDQPFNLKINQDRRF